MFCTEPCLREYIETNIEEGKLMDAPLVFDIILVLTAAAAVAVAVVSETLIAMLSVCAGGIQHACPGIGEQCAGVYSQAELVRWKLVACLFGRWRVAVTFNLRIRIMGFARITVRARVTHWHGDDPDYRLRLSPDALAWSDYLPLWRWAAVVLMRCCCCSRLKTGINRRKLNVIL